MAQFFFILGHQPAISLAELQAVWQKKAWQARILAVDQEFVVVDLKITEQEVLKLIDILGGTIKGGVCEQVSEIKKSEVLKILTGNHPAGQKIFFGLSYYGIRQPDALLKEPLKVFALKIKRTLSEIGHSVRWVQSKEHMLSSVIVAKNKLLEGGGEIVFLDLKTEIWLGRTLAVQGFKDFGQRDFGRPQRDMESGMLPPKLARVMLNLSQAETEDVVLDPFCGSGTVLQEALVLGYQEIWGSDLSQKAIADTEANLKWLAELDHKQVAGKCSVKIGDAQKLTEIWPEKSVDAIVSEPYLGPNRGHFEVSKIKEELQRLYSETLKQFHKVLKPGGVVVWLWPVWQAGAGDLIFVPAVDLAAAGFAIEPLLPEVWEQKLGVRKSPRGGLIYVRVGQKVAREVLKMRRV